MEINVKRGVILIKPVCERVTDGEERPEILAMQFFAVQCADEVDVTCVQNADHRRAVVDLIVNYKPDRSREIDIKMTLILKDDEPISQKARRLSQAERDIVNAQIESWEKQGIVRPSISEFASPIVLVKKKNDTY